MFYWRIKRTCKACCSLGMQHKSRRCCSNDYNVAPVTSKVRLTSKWPHNKRNFTSTLSITRKYYPSSNQFRDPPTYTHQPSMQQKVPFSLIRCSSSKVAFCSCVEWGWHIYNIVESESDPLTRRAVDLFEKEPLKGNSEVHLHTPTKFGEDRSKDLGGDREQTDRQTDKRCSIYSMIWKLGKQTTTFFRSCLSENHTIKKNNNKREVIGLWDRCLKLPRIQGLFGNVWER